MLSIVRRPPAGKIRGPSGQYSHVAQCEQRYNQCHDASESSNTISPSFASWVYPRRFPLQIEQFTDVVWRMGWGWWAGPLSKLYGCGLARNLYGLRYCSRGFGGINRIAPVRPFFRWKFTEKPGRRRFHRAWKPSVLSRDSRGTDSTKPLINHPKPNGIERLRLMDSVLDDDSAVLLLEPPVRVQAPQR